MGARSKRILALLNDRRHKNYLVGDINLLDQDEAAQVGKDQQMKVLSGINELQDVENHNWSRGSVQRRPADATVGTLGCVCSRRVGALGQPDVSMVGAHVMKKATFLTLISLPFGGCITDMGEQLPDPKPVSADSISSIALQGGTVSFIVSCTVGDPCWRFVRSDYSISGQSVAVTVYARPINATCPAVVVSIKAPATVVVPSSGSYTFRFWRYGGQTLDTTLTIQ